MTGAEALYADMGHFGKKPIWLAQYGIVFPSLLLNYAGQSALILAGADSKQNLFYTLCPPVLRVPLIILAALATIIASQAIITGAFSMTRRHTAWLVTLITHQADGGGKLRSDLYRDNQLAADGGNHRAGGVL